MNVGGSISTRVTVYATTVLTVVGLAVSYAVYAPHQQILKEKELERLHAVSEEQHNRIIDSFARLREDVQFLADTPPIAGFARARAAGGRDPLNGDTEAVWRSRLQTIFLSFIRRKPEYSQVRLIDRDGDGFEIVRVDRRGPNYLVGVPREELQRKRDLDYVQAALKLSRDGVYLSPINLNREYDRVTLPRTPTIRASTPVYGVDGEPFGVLVINQNLTSLFADLERGRPKGGGLYLTNSSGDVLIDTATQMTFGFDLGRPYRLQDDLPELEPFYNAESDLDRGLYDLTHQAGVAANEYVLQMTKIRIDPADSGRFLGLGLYSSYDALLGDSAAVGRKSSIAAALMIILGSLLVFGYLRRLLRPLALVAESTVRVASGEYDVELPAESDDEIGRLSHSFRSMVDQVEERNNTLEERTKEIEVQQAALLSTNARLEASKREVELMAGELRQASLYNKSEFLARMAHDLRTPLNSMLILAKPLVDNTEGNLTEEQQESARILSGAGADLLALVDDLLDLSKAEAGKVEIARVETNIFVLADRLRSQLLPLAEVKGLEFRVEIDPLLPDVFVTDPRRLRRILSNLLSNALKFTESGSVALIARRVIGQQNDYGVAAEEVSFAVHDTGAGIPADQLGSIFTPYQRLVRDKGSTQEGTGLGLAIVKELTTALGGELYIDSQLGEGSQFEIRLPLQVQEINDVRESSTTVFQEVESDGQTKKVLVVDDNGATRWALVRAFRKLDPEVTVDEAETGSQALEAIRSRTYRCVVLDLQLPQLDGWGVLKALAANPPKVRPCILLYTGGEMSEAQRKEVERLSAKLVPKDGSLDTILAAARLSLSQARQSGMNGAAPANVPASALPAQH